MTIRAAELPIVGSLADLFQSTATGVVTAFLTASLLAIVGMLVWSHISDRETGRWWKALIVWLVAAALTGSALTLQAWSRNNLKVTGAEQVTSSSAFVDRI